MSSTTVTLQDVALVDDLFNVAATETAPLFEHLDFKFCLTSMCRPLEAGANTSLRTTRPLCGFLHCYYENVCGTRPVIRKLQHSRVWYYCGLNKSPSGDTVDRFPTGLEHVIDDISDRIVFRSACEWAWSVANSKAGISSPHTGHSIRSVPSACNASLTVSLFIISSW